MAPSGCPVWCGIRLSWESGSGPYREGKVRSFHVDRVTVANLLPVTKESMDEDVNLQTDEATVYYFMRKDFPNHDTVTHKRKQYVRYDGPKMVTTNTAEGYFSLLKRGIHGTYHHVSRHQLHRYLGEFDFRYNSRDVSDSERAQAALAGAEGKRLTYRDSSSRA